MRSSHYKDWKDAVGRRLLTLRHQTRLTQAELAGRLGVKRRSIHNWEAEETYR